jgi:DNA-binding transcriptional regulator YiaG
MAITVAASLDGPWHEMGVSRMMSRRGKAVRESRRGWRRAVGLPAEQAMVPNAEVLPIPDPHSPPGVIGAAVIRAARLSAHLTRPRLARQLNVNVATVRSWENGTIPLFCVPYDQLQQLAGALKRPDAEAGGELGELLSASKCDLLLAGMLRRFEDYAEVPPIEEHSTNAETARELLRWALAGTAPDRYRQYASPLPLLDKDDIDLVTAMARDLLTGSHGHDLVGYGSALIALTDR